MEAAEIPSLSGLIFLIALSVGCDPGEGDGGPERGAARRTPPPSADVVVGIERLRGPSGAKELLKKNGFVVVPRFYRQIFSPYIQETEDFPPFVTTDSLHRTFHVIFEEQIKKVETAFAGEAAAISREMREYFEHRERAAREKLLKAGVREATELARDYFTVADLLLAGEGPPAGPWKKVAEELDLIRSGRGVQVSPVLGHKIDYSQYKPRGFYTETETLQRYFRGMSWYGLAAFRLIDDRETSAAILIADAFMENEALRSRWENIDSTHTYLLGPADDLTPPEYAEALVSARAVGAGGDELARLRAVARSLRDPTVNSMVIAPELMPRWKELTKGMRFFGKRHIPDSEAFMHLTYPEVPKRLFPSGLDVMAANGSSRAAELLDESGATEMRGHAEGMRKAVDRFAEMKKEGSPSHYVEFLKLVETITAPPAEDALPFMMTPAYADKDLATALAAWASTRHTWQLAAKQSVTYACAHPWEERFAGCVEPNLAFYGQLRRLIRRTLELLKPIPGADLKRLQRLDDLVKGVARIAREQMAGKALSEEQAELLDTYGARIASLSYFEGNSFEAEGLLEWMSLVADVHTEHLTAQCLEVGTGAAMPIYVAVPHKGSLHLSVGGVYSYYEFLRPISGRLTDEERRGLVAGGKTPPMPAWTSSFVAGYDADALFERLKGGEVPAGLLYLDDPRIEEFLAEEIRPGGVFDGKESLEMAVRVYALKARRRAVPLLMGFLATGDTREWKERKTEYGIRRRLVDGRCELAAGALQGLAGPEEMPELLRIATCGDGKREGPALKVMKSVRRRAAE